MRRAKKWMMAATAGVVVVGLMSVAGTTAFAMTNSPKVTVTGPTATVTTTTATVTYSANRGGKQLVGGAPTCALTGPTTSTDCGTVTTAKGSTTGTVSLTGLQNGTYTYTVTITLTDGGSATGSASFTVNAGPVCWDSNNNNSSAFFAHDLALTGPLNTYNDATGYNSTDGTCSGGLRFSITVVQAPDLLSALDACGLIPFDSLGEAFNLEAFGYSTAPNDYWFCV